MKKKKNNRNKKFLVLSVLFLGILGLSVASIFNDWLEIVSNKQQLASLSNYYEELLLEQESLSSEVTKLHDAEYIARYAREKYMYSLPGEYIIRLPQD